jgi:hypothetical protein
MKDPLGFMPPHGNYSQLQSYLKAEVVYDLTYRFCHRFLSQKDRTIGRMIQAARSASAVTRTQPTRNYRTFCEITDEIFNED